MTSSSREQVCQLLIQHSIDPKTVLDDGSLNEVGYWRLGAAPKGYRHPVKLNRGEAPRHFVPWPEGFPVQEILRLLYPNRVGGYTYSTSGLTYTDIVGNTRISWFPGAG